MRYFLRHTGMLAAIALLSACSRSSAPPAVSDDLQKDLAKVGGSDMQLAGASTPKLEVVSASERGKSYAPAPKAPHVARAATVTHGTTAPVPAPKAEQPTVVHTDAPSPQTPSPAPVEIPRQSLPSPGRPQEPRPSTQREPRGGWKTPGQIIRGAPFPINP